MKAYLGTRILHSAVSLIGLIVLVFFMVRLTGNPVDMYMPIDAPEVERQHFIELHGLDQPTIVQFGNFVADIFRLDFGQSLRLGLPALDVVLRAFPTTLMLAFLSMGLALTISILTGTLAASRPGSIFDRLATILSLVAASVPSFWLAIVGVLIFAVQLRWLPTSGTGSILQWVLPVTVLFVRPCGLIVQVVRGSMVSALSAAYAKTAAAKGVKRKAVLFVHALRNAMLPVISVAGDQAASIVNGAVIVETIFGFAGVGKLMIDSIHARDFAVIQATVIVTAISIFIMNIVIDLMYTMLDPRIRHN